jgi:hypothetical protein
MTGIESNIRASGFTHCKAIMNLTAFDFAWRQPQFREMGVGNIEILNHQVKAALNELRFRVIRQHQVGAAAHFQYRESIFAENHAHSHELHELTGFGDAIRVHGNVPDPHRWS